MGRSIERDGARWALAGALVVLSGLIAWAHLFALAEVPRGLYVDESSIGLNAVAIADQGRDEHGVRFPVYFRAFGEYKNPLYIYAAALIFKLAGVSVLTLRLTSSLFFFVLLGGLWCLARQLVPESPAVALWAVAAAGFLPWFFTLSRIAFEVISQPAVVAWVLFLVAAVYNTERRRPLLAFVLGLAAGISIYTYSTARLLTPIFLLTLLASYAARRYWRRHLLVLAGAGVAAIPYAVFVLTHPRALMTRFRLLTFVFRESLSIREKIGLFSDNYWLFWSPRYLLFEGDPHPRQGTGFAGEVYLVVFALAVAGMVWSVRYQQEGRRPFVRLLALNLLAAPVAAALTEGRSALRSNLLGLFLVVFSCLGFALLLRIRDPRRRWAACAAVVLLLAIESGRYLRHYFGAYVPLSMWAIGSYDFQGALETAFRQNPTRIIVSRRFNQPEALLGFYLMLLPHRPDIPIVVARPRAEPGICVIYFRPKTNIPGAERYHSRVWDFRQPTILRCFDPLPAGAKPERRAAG